MIYDHDVYAVALYLASQAHKGQTDKAGKPYIGHLVRVADTFKDYRLKTIAILHDILEDTWVTEEILRNLFSTPICDAVILLTRKENESYKEFIMRVAQNDDAIKVKIADLNDNMDLSRLPEVTDEDLNRVKKYNKWRNYLRDILEDNELPF